MFLYFNYIELTVLHYKEKAKKYEKTY